ncbi:MAG: hypothetical protein HY081_00660 [Gammaproteobacteria bacterium]|nr:hypothetical protein [Gammaproteobacteria bacterium]
MSLGEKAVCIAATLLIFFACGAVSHGIPMESMLGIRSIGWMWIPFFVPLGFGALFMWFIFSKR